MQLKLSHWSETSPLRYRKEAIYAGDWPNTAGGKTPVTELSLRHIAGTLIAMRGVGLSVPLTKGTPHTNWSDPSNKVGEVVGASVEPNDDGVPALYLDIAFASEADRDLAVKNDVSVGIDSEFVDGKDRVWVGALRHLALTATPVVPNLEPFMAIAASFANKVTNMTILEALGVDNEAAALEAVKALQDKAKATAEKVELSHNPKLVRSYLQNRITELELSVKSGEIGPVLRDRLMKDYATDKHVALELSHGDETSEYDRVIELVKLASKNPPVPTHGRTTTPKNGEIVLSHDGGGTTYNQRFSKWADARRKSLNNGSQN